MKKTIAIMVLSFMVFACKQNMEESDLPIINLEDLDKPDCSIQLSDLVDSVKYIALDTNNDCFLEGNCMICGVSEDYFYINSLHKVYQFDKNGKFLKQIGTQGKGPTEYSGINSVKFFNSKIYILTWTGEVVIYSSEGDFLDKILLPQGIINSFGVVNDSVYIAEEKIYTKQNMILYLNIFDSKKRISQRIIQNDNSEVRRSFSNYSEFYVSGQYTFYKNLYQDTIYQIDRKGQIIPVKLLSYGKYTPNRDMWENVSKREEAMNAGYIFCQMSFEGGSYSFIWSIKHSQNYLTVYDNKHSQVVYNQQVPQLFIRANVGIEDDITAIGTFFWPGYVNGNELLNLTNACNYSPETLRAFQKQGIEIDENSNPVVTICYLKDR